MTQEEEIINLYKKRETALTFDVATNFDYCPKCREKKEEERNK